MFNWKLGSGSSKTAQFKAEEVSIDFLKAHEESDQVCKETSSGVCLYFYAIEIKRNLLSCRGPDNKFYLALSRRWMATPPLSENSKHFNEEAEEDEEGKSSYEVFVRRVLKRTEWENEVHGYPLTGTQRGSNRWRWSLLSRITINNVIWLFSHGQTFNCQPFYSFSFLQGFCIFGHQPNGFFLLSMGIVALY